MPSGNYEVGIVYQGKRRSIGTFNTLDDAILANKVARGMLKAESGQLSAEQAARNVQSAKDAIKAAGVVNNATPGRPRSIINNGTPVKEKKSTNRQLPDGTFARPRGAGKVGFEWDYTKGVWTEKYGFEQSSTTKIKKPVVTASQTAPRQLPDGTFAKPCGRVVKGCKWNASRGVWVPLSESPQRKKRHSQAREDNAYTKTYKTSNRSSASRSPVVLNDEKKVPVDKQQEGPRQLPDGTYARPRGKGRVGFEWDYTKGLWVPEASSAEEEEVQEAAPQAKSMLSGLFGKKIE